MVTGRLCLLFGAAAALAIPSFALRAQQPLAEQERAEALRMLHPMCRIYYEERERCVSAKLPPARARRDLDGELTALTMLSFGNRAATGCLRQLRNAKAEKTFGCEWSMLPDDVTDYLEIAGTCGRGARRSAPPEVCSELPALRAVLAEKYASHAAVLRVLDLYRE